MTKSNHPKKVKVGPYHYINRNQTAERAADTLLHEVLHAVWDVAGLDQVPMLHEEVVVRAFATHLTDILNSNPQLTDFILNPHKTWVPRYEKDPLKEAADEL